MFDYTQDISKLAHEIIEKYVIEKDIAIDATLGNGHDTDFLKNIFKVVHSFDINEEAVLKYEDKKNKNVYVYQMSHEYIDNFFIDGTVDLIIYNLGFLPNGNKEITTKAESTIISIEKSLNLIKTGGYILIVTYRGHFEGLREDNAVFDFLSKIPKNEYGVMMHKTINRNDVSPILYLVEKKGV